MGNTWPAPVAWQAPWWQRLFVRSVPLFSLLYRAERSALESDETRPRRALQGWVWGCATARLPGSVLPKHVGGKPFLFKNKHSWSVAANVKFTRIF